METRHGIEHKSYCKVETFLFLNFSSRKLNLYDFREREEFSHLKCGIKIEMSSAATC